MSESDAARNVRLHKSSCVTCSMPGKLLVCAEGERLLNISVDEFLKIERKR